MSDGLPRSFGRYQALAPLGKGGMGEVFIGRLRERGGFTRAVAIKTLLPHLASEPSIAEMFLREARNAACIRHPNVAQTHDLGEASDGSMFFVMDLVQGESLDTLASLAGQVPVAIAVEIIAQAADGLEAAHRAIGPSGEVLGLVHCDVSPQNIMVGSDGMARVVDFGIAKARRVGTSTVGGGLQGKVSYVAPEQISGEQVGADTDVFALGIVLWELLTSEPLFDGSHPAAILDQVLNRPIPRASELRGDVPDGLSDLVQWALTRDRAARPQSAREFSRALRRLAMDSQLATTTDDVGSWVESVGGSILCERRAIIDAALSLPDDPRPEPPRARRSWLLGAGALVIAGAAVGLWALRAPSSPPAQVSAPTRQAARSVPALPAAPPPRLEPTPFADAIPTTGTAGAVESAASPEPAVADPSVADPGSSLTRHSERRATPPPGAGHEAPTEAQTEGQVSLPTPSAENAGPSQDATTETLLGLDAFDRFVGG